MPTVSLKTALKASLADLEASDPGRMTRSRTAVNASFAVTTLPGFFRLGESLFWSYAWFGLSIVGLGFYPHSAVLARF